MSSNFNVIRTDGNRAGLLPPLKLFQLGLPLDSLNASVRRDLIVLLGRVNVWSRNGNGYIRVAGRFLGSGTSTHTVFEGAVVDMSASLRRSSVVV